MVTGFTAAAMHAAGLLRGRRDAYHRAGFLIPFTFAAALVPLQIAAGTWPLVLFQRPDVPVDGS